MHRCARAHLPISVFFFPVDYIEIPSAIFCSVRTPISMKFFPRFFLLYFLVFHIYFFSYAYGMDLVIFLGLSSSFLVSILSENITSMFFQAFHIWLSPQLQHLCNTSSYTSGTVLRYQPESSCVFWHCHVDSFLFL